MSGGSFYGSYGSIDIDNESEKYTIPQLIAFLKTTHFLSTDYEKVQRRLIMREEKIKLEAMEAARREAVGVAEIEKIRKEVAAEAEARVRNELVKTIQKEADEKMAACKREEIGRVRREAAAIKKKMEEKMEEMRSEAARQLDREKTCAEILEMRLKLTNKMKLVAELKLQDYEKEVADMKLRLSEEMKAKEVAVKEAEAANAKKEAAYELNEKTTAKLLKEINKVRQEVVKKAKIDELFKKNLGGVSGIEHDQNLKAKFQELKKNNDLLRSECDQAYKEKLLLEERFRVNEKRFEDLRKAFLELKKESDLKSSTIENQMTQLAVAQALKNVAVHEKKVSDDKVKQMEFNNILQMRKAYESLPWVSPLSDPMGKFDQSASGTRSAFSVNDKGKAALDAARGDDGRAQAALGLTNKVVANASGISPDMIQFIKLATEGPASIAHKSAANVTGSFPLNANMNNNNNVKELGKPPRSPSKNLNIGSPQLGDKRKLASPIKEPATKAARSLIVGKEAASPSYSIQFKRESKLSGLCLCPSPVENNHKEGHSGAINVVPISISNNSKGTSPAVCPNRPNSEI